MDTFTGQFQPRFSERTGAYCNCKWCGGRGCLACPGEADKDYKKEFPDGLKPIATIKLDEPLNLDTEAGQKKFVEIIREHVPDIFK